MYYTIYKITNNITGRIYIGMHQTNYLNDGYMGSGLLLKQSFEKYGIENFSKEILYVFEDSEKMREMEAILVNEEFVNSKNTYNIQLGGVGGPKDAKQTTYYKSGEHLDNVKEAQKQAALTHKKLKEQRIKIYYEHPKLCNHCNNPIDYNKQHNVFCSSSCSATFNNTGRVTSKEQKKKTSEKLLTEKGRQHRIRKEQRKVTYIERIEHRKQMIKSFTFNRGWVTKVSKLTGIPRNKMKQWIKKHMPDTYNQAYSK